MPSMVEGPVHIGPRGWAFLLRLSWISRRAQRMQWRHESRLVQSTMYYRQWSLRLVRNKSDYLRMQESAEVWEAVTIAATTVGTTVGTTAGTTVDTTAATKTKEDDQERTTFPQPS